MEAPAGLEPSITGLWCETAELNCTLPYLTKASVLTFALRCHIAELWCPRPSSLKLQETKDDRSFVQWYTKIRLWRLLREIHLRTLPPESIKPAKYSGRGTPARQSYTFFLFNPTILFQIAREVCHEYVVSLHLDKSVSILNEVDNVCIHCFNGATCLYAPNGFNGHHSDCQPFTLAQPPVPSLFLTEYLKILLGTYSVAT